MKILTLDDYKKAGVHFWDKYWYVSSELGADCKTEDVLKVMEALGAVALKFKNEEDKEGPFGFNKKEKEDDAGV